MVRPVGALLFLLLVADTAAASPSERSELVISGADRRIDLTSHIVRVMTSLMVENAGPDSASEVLLAFPNYQVQNMANIMCLYTEGDGKGKGPSISLPLAVTHPDNFPQNLTFYSIHLPNKLQKGGSIVLNVLAVFAHSLKPLPEEITQAEPQLVVFQDSAHLLSPYLVKVQTLGIRMPSGKVESYTKYPNTKLVDSELRYGSFDNVPAFSFLPLSLHFENNNPFKVAHEVVREVEISHWGSIQITEHYNLVHGGARMKGGFSRIDYQARPSLRGASSYRHLIAILPPRAHSVYYRDEIGNISTSILWGDSKKTQLELEPRFPMFGGWKTSFTIGYGVPLQDFLFESEGKRFLNITFGSPLVELAVDNLFVKVVLPEGSKEISVSVPFSVKQWHEVKYSHLDIAGRPVVVLEKANVVPEHNLYFQVHYKFNNLSLLREPVMLIFGFFLLFVAYIVYMHTDISLSKSSASYLAKVRWDEAQGTVQQVENIINECLAAHSKLEASIRDLSRTGDVQTCKAARKTVDGLLKESAKELKPLLGALQSSPLASRIWPKVEELVAKEKELQEKFLLKHTIIVESFEKKQGTKETESRVASLEQKISVLRQEVEDLLEIIDEI